MFVNQAFLMHGSQSHGDLNNPAKYLENTLFTQSVYFASNAIKACKYVW